MPTRHQNSATPRPAGYAALIKRYRLEVFPNWHRSLVATSGSHRIDSTDGGIREVYPAKYWPGDRLGDHLEFAMKYDGTNLGILESLFHSARAEEITRELIDYLQSKPTGKYARRLWFLYEWLTGKQLPLEDLKQGNYIGLLDPEHYYTAEPARQVRRQRINENLLGNRQFCPTVRRTNLLRQFEEADLPGRCVRVVSNYSPELLQRALSYLYTKETKSSFEIEQILPNSTRIERFIGLLQMAEREDFGDKSHLIDLHNRIVDPRYQASDYRSNQTYVGESIAWQKEKVHYACPRPQDLADLMDGLIDAHRRIDSASVSPVVHAAAIAYGFVYLHPFEDGNGRIHRFLIHNILARRGFTPEGLMFPVSATMLSGPAEYDASLEAFSRLLMELVEYTLDEEGRMTIDGNTSRWYRTIDMTFQAESLFSFIDKTISTELVTELDFLANYSQTKQAIQEVVDMPDRQIDLLIRFCLQNEGRLSDRKRGSHFSHLSDREIARMQEIVQSAYGVH